MLLSRFKRLIMWALFAAVPFLLAYPAVSGGSELYRWIDEDGVSHYSDQPPASPAKGSALQVKRLRQPSVTRGTQEFIIPFESIGQGMLVDVLINDAVSAKMLVDTGATVIKLNKRLLNRLDQDIPEDRRRGYVATAGGVIRAEEVFLNKIDVGGAVKENVRAISAHEAYDEALFDGLLGMSFLSDFKMTIDHRNNRIHLMR